MSKILTKIKNIKWAKIEMKTSAQIRQSLHGTLYFLNEKPYIIKYLMIHCCPKHTSRRIFIESPHSHFNLYKYFNIQSDGSNIQVCVLFRSFQFELRSVLLLKDLATMIECKFFLRGKIFIIARKYLI